MTADPPRATSGLTFHGPLSEERAVRLTGELAARTPATVLDIGCGWGELTLRILAAAPNAIGTGVDINSGDIRRARDNAAARGLDGRATFVEGPAKEHLASARADLILNVGAYHALGTIPEALAEIRERVNPGGRVLFGAEYWERPPTEGELANMWPGITAEDCTDLATLAERTIAAGFSSFTRARTPARSRISSSWCLKLGRSPCSRCWFQRVSPCGPKKTARWLLSTPCTA